RAEAGYYNAPQFERPTYQAAWSATLEPAIEAARQVRENVQQQAIDAAVEEAISAAEETRERDRAVAAESRAQGNLLIEIFGNPSRPVKIDPNWLPCNSGAAAAILQMVWEEQRFAELPYLADALMDAGCGEEVLLRHLREPRGHV